MRSGDFNAAGTQGFGWVNGIFNPDQSGVPGNSYFIQDLSQGLMYYQDCFFDSFVEMRDGFTSHATGSALNCGFNQGGVIETFAICGGYANNLGFGLGVDGALDLDCIVAGLTIDESSFIGYCNVTGGTIFVYPGTNLIIDDGLNGTAGASLYGAAGLTVGAKSAVLQRSGSTWAARLQLTGTLSLMDTTGPVTTGTSYAGGTWTDSRALTTANLDTYGALTNPKTGATFTIASGP